MFLPTIPLVIMIACAVLAYRYAEMEGMSGIGWAAASVALWLAPRFLWPAGLLIRILLQVGLLVAIRGLAIRRHGSG